MSDSLQKPPLKSPSAKSPMKRHEERERAEAQALAQVAASLEERQHKTRQLRKLRLSQKQKTKR